MMTLCTPPDANSIKGRPRRVPMQPESVARQLWRKAREGDSQAYEELFAIHASRLLVFIRARLGEGLRAKLEAEDILQETYLAAHRSFSEFSYSDEGAFFRWVCRIVNNRLRDAADHFAAQKRQQLPRQRAAWTGPQTALRRLEGQQQIEDALQKLSPEHREVILLRYFEGLGSEETAARMGRTTGAVRNLLSRALVELGKHIKTVESGGQR